MDGPKKSWSSRPKTHLFLWQFLFSKAKSEVFHKVAQAYKIFLHGECYFIKVLLSVRNLHVYHEFIIAYPSCPNDDDVLSGLIFLENLSLFVRYSRDATEAGWCVSMYVAGRPCLC